MESINQVPKIAQLDTHIANAVAHMFVPYKLGNVGDYTAGLFTLSGAGGTAALVADKLYSNQFFVPTPHTFDRIGINVTVAVDTKNIRFGIYADGGLQAPSGNPLLDAGVFTMSGTGVQMAEVTINQQLTAGLWWVVMVTDSTPTVSTFAMANPSRGTNVYITPQNAYYTTQTYGTLPTPHPTPTILTAGVIKGIIMRIASIP
jgi:hypothetical protein